MESLSPQQIETILNEIKQFRPQLVYLFGSFAKQEMTPESDLDIGFYYSQLVLP